MLSLLHRKKQYVYYLTLYWMPCILFFQEVKYWAICTNVTALTYVIDIFFHDFKVKGQ